MRQDVDRSGDDGRVTILDDGGRSHQGVLGRLGPAFAEIDLTDAATDLRPDDPVRLRIPGVALDRPGRVVRSGPHLVVQLANIRERRTHLRVPFARRVRWRDRDEVDWHDARGEDLSSAGVRFVSTAAPTLGARVEIELPVLGTSVVEVSAEVLAVSEHGRWHRIRCRFVAGRSADVLDLIGRTVHTLDLE